ncbi:Protein of unknown function [Pyronema omphalodes CBS 100304]|uniref:Uncharacterized protein n=1 Tax=Pyronema omphalodes (strain CBS 100304) TaxID=1076935 RepID=U4LD79_PYROM|nr:Protein of unknown function [Pyronema omphalodes CBS 100304]
MQNLQNRLEGYDEALSIEKRLTAQLRQDLERLSAEPTELRTLYVDSKNNTGSGLEPISDKTFEEKMCNICNDTVQKHPKRQHFGAFTVVPDSSKTPTTKRQFAL